MSSGDGEDPHQRCVWLLRTPGTGKDPCKADLLSSGNSALSSGRQCHLCSLLCIPRGHLPSLSDNMMINLLSFSSSQQCYFLQILVAIQGAGDLTAPAFITFMAMQCWQEISWLEGKVLAWRKVHLAGTVDSLGLLPVPPPMPCSPH